MKRMESIPPEVARQGVQFGLAMMLVQMLGLGAKRGGIVRVEFAPPDAPRPPTVVCLCGSTRFMDAFLEEGWRETLAGKIVLSVGVSKHLPPDHGGEALGPEVAAMLDELHLRKIDMADEVLVLNVGGYIGDSTASEIAYAQERGVPVRYLEPPSRPEGT